jgi:hypothetical protein
MRACPVTGQARMSYRRAAELFTTLTKPLDPAGRGWTLHQLSASHGADLTVDAKSRQDRAASFLVRKTVPRYT